MQSGSMVRALTDCCMLAYTGSLFHWQLAEVRCQTRLRDSIKSHLTKMSHVRAVSLITEQTSTQDTEKMQTEMHTSDHTKCFAARCVQHSTHLLRSILMAGERSGGKATDCKHWAVQCNKDPHSTLHLENMQCLACKHYRKQYNTQEVVQ